jgi:hypothetical protein
LLTESQPDRGFETRERLRFETLLADISARFVNVSPGQVDCEIEDAQRAICECLEVDRSSLVQVSSDGTYRLLLTHLYRSSDLEPAPESRDRNPVVPLGTEKTSGERDRFPA